MRSQYRVTKTIGWWNILFEGLLLRLREKEEDVEETSDVEDSEDDEHLERC